MKVKDIIKIAIYKILLRPFNFLFGNILLALQEKGQKVLVYSVMPPATTGMAPFALKIFNKRPNNFLIINKFNNIFEYFSALFYEKNFNKDIIDISVNNTLIKKYPTACKIFVIGNSPHHDETFKMAVKTKGEPNRYLYIGENLLLSPPLNYLKGWKKKPMEDIIKKYYNKNIEITFKEDINAVWVKNGISGLKIARELTGINNFIVFNEYSKKMFAKEFTQDELNEIEINVIKQPIDQIENINPIDELLRSETKLVGSFGIPQNQKSTNDIIEAINILNQNGENIKLVLAGYAVDNYLKTLNTNLENIIVYDNPPTPLLLSLMKTVDIAIQLRPNTQGESSGCISELFGLKKKFITTKNFINEELENYCITVPPYIPPIDLADVISNGISEPSPENFDNIFNEYSFSKASEKIYQIIGEKLQNEI